MKRGAAKIISESLTQELKGFINQILPFMKLLTRPQMGAKQWKEIETTLGVNLSEEGDDSYESLNLNKVLDAGLQDHVDKIEALRSRIA